MKPTERKEIARSWLASLLLGLLGHRYNGIAISSSGVTLLSRAPRQIAFNDITHPLKVTKTLGKPSVVITIRQANEIKVVGFKRSDAVDFVTSANDAWRRHFVEQVDRADGELRTLAETVGHLNQPKRYPSACLLQPFLVRANDVAEKLPAEIPNGVLPLEQQKVLNQVLAFQKEPGRMREAAIKSFTGTELCEFKGFFDTIESNPLTSEQRLAVITDEDATLELVENPDYEVVELGEAGIAEHRCGACGGRPPLLPGHRRSGIEDAASHPPRGRDAQAAHRRPE